MNQESNNLLIIKKGFNSWKTPGDRECFGHFSDEGNLLEITFPADISETPVTIDIMAGEKRAWSAKGTVLPHFFVLENTKMIMDQETGEIDPLSVYCTDEQEARRILKSPKLFKVILSIFRNQKAISVAITDDTFSVSWINFKPSPENDSVLLSSMFAHFDRIADELNAFSAYTKKSSYSDAGAADSEDKDQQFSANDFFLLFSSVEGYHILTAVIILACVSFFAAIPLHVIGLTGWTFRKFFIPAVLLFLLYYYLIHVHYFSIWDSTRLRGSEKNPGEPVRFIIGLSGSLFFGFILVIVTFFPVAYKNIYRGTQAVISDSAVIAEKNPGGGSENYDPSFIVKNSQGFSWSVNVKETEFKSYQEGDSYPVKLYRGSAGLLYSR